MQGRTGILTIISGLLGIAVFVIGVLNLVFVHPVPGVIAILLSVLYLPPFNTLLRNKFGFTVPVAVKIVLGVAVIWFTLGVSDLGDLLNEWLL